MECKSYLGLPYTNTLCKVDLFPPTHRHTHFRIFDLIFTFFILDAYCCLFIIDVQIPGIYGSITVVTPFWLGETFVIDMFVLIFAV